MPCANGEKTIEPTPSSEAVMLLAAGDQRLFEPGADAFATEEA